MVYTVAFSADYIISLLLANVLYLGLKGAQGAVIRFPSALYAKKVKFVMPPSTRRPSTGATSAPKRSKKTKLKDGEQLLTVEREAEVKHSHSIIARAHRKYVGAHVSSAGGVQHAPTNAHRIGGTYEWKANTKFPPCTLR